MAIHRYACEKCELSRSEDVDVTIKASSSYKFKCPRCNRVMDWVPPGIQVAPDWGVTEHIMMKSVYTDDPTVIDKTEGKAAYREHFDLYEKRYGKRLSSKALEDAY